VNPSNLTNVAASVRQRLMNITHETGDAPNVIWTRYAIERLLYRLSVSEYAEDFVLKGAVLFMVWSNKPHRPTMDLDLLGYGQDSHERIEGIFRRICQTEHENDGLIFDEKSIQVEPIREELEYQGRRVSLLAYLGKARIPLQVDIGFGDAVTPRPEMINFPCLLDFSQPRIKAYSQVSVIAEKFHAMVILGITNSRMKDFYDLYVLASRFTFDGALLVKAVKATFRRRKTVIPDQVPMALTAEFAQDNMKRIQWNAFVQKSGIEKEVPDFLEVLTLLRAFLLPVMQAAQSSGESPEQWKPGGGWIGGCCAGRA
jgi:predicted nucleotidyltransferase component of viral defense system